MSLYPTGVTAAAAGGGPVRVSPRNRLTAARAAIAGRRGSAERVRSIQRMSPAKMVKIEEFAQRIKENIVVLGNILSEESALLFDYQDKVIFVNAYIQEFNNLTVDKKLNYDALTNESIKRLNLVVNFDYIFDYIKSFDSDDSNVIDTFYLSQLYNLHYANNATKYEEITEIDFGEAVAEARRKALDVATAR
jgi:hypothetical protein